MVVTEGIDQTANVTFGIIGGVLGTSVAFQITAVPGSASGAMQCS